MKPGDLLRLKTEHGVSLWHDLDDQSIGLRARLFDDDVVMIIGPTARGKNGATYVEVASSMGKGWILAMYLEDGLITE